MRKNINFQYIFSNVLVINYFIFIYYLKEMNYFDYEICDNNKNNKSQN